MIAKAELHCHIEGAASPELVRSLAAKHGIELTGLFDDDGGYRWHDFTTFLDAYDRASTVFRTAADYEALAFEYLTSLAREGAIYSEVFASPDHAAFMGCSYLDMIDAIARGIERASRDNGILGRIIVTCLRHLGPDHAIEVARLAADNPHPAVTGFGMAGDERQFHPRDFKPAYHIAADAGLGLTAHAGEFGGPDSVRAALDHLPVTRIGHGVRAIEEPALVERLASDEIVLEVSPGSNVALGLYQSLADHPIDALRCAGVRLCLNSDDPPYFHTSLDAEYRSVAKTFSLSDDTMLTFTRTAVEAAFVDDDTRAALRARLIA